MPSGRQNLYPNFKGVETLDRQNGECPVAPMQLWWILGTPGLECHTMLVYASLWSSCGWPVMPSSSDGLFCSRGKPEVLRLSFLEACVVLSCSSVFYLFCSICVLSHALEPRLGEKWKIHSFSQLLDLSMSCRFRLHWALRLRGRVQAWGPSPQDSSIHC